jgi:hypothetical protein
VNAGLADAVLPLGQIAGELQRRCERAGTGDTSRNAVAVGDSH